tara:strand:- start:860 stop:1330 length:471 start_codon:yes stop_codon:yes gene_type:complete
MTPIRTYIVVPADFAEIIELGRQMQQESVYRHFNFSENKCAMLLHTCITNPDTHFARIAVTGADEIVGILLGEISEHYFGTDLIASDYLWYVAPAHRGSKAGLMLLNDFQAWAKERSAAEVYIGVSSGVSAEKTGALLCKLGYDLVGGNYKLRVVV